VRLGVFFAENPQNQPALKVLGFGGNLGYRLHPESISTLFADLFSTTHV